MKRDVTCVVLAAGTSQRFPDNKLLRRLPGGETLLECALRACGAFPAVVVCSPALAGMVDRERITIAINDHPELGMSHSLELAHRIIDPARAIGVLPADLALIEPEHVRLVVDASGETDVVFPSRADGTPGHPVIFSAHARDAIADLPLGDTIRRLRDRPNLTRRVLQIEDPWPYRDVDRESDLTGL